ncbi:MAG: hypothetical protein V4590_01565 [Bacteroidota bacterium]
MTTSILKTELTKAIAGITDKSLLEALYTIVNHAEKTESSDFELSDEDMKIIEGRSKAYKAGKTKTITMGEMRKRFTKRYTS